LETDRVIGKPVRCLVENKSRFDGKFSSHAVNSDMRN